MPALVFAFLKHPVRPTHTDQSPQSRSKFIHPSRNPLGVSLLARPPVAPHRPVNIVLAPTIPYPFPEGRRDALRHACYGVWCAGESGKLGRVCIGASGYALRAGARCARLDTMIAGCDAWAVPIAWNACAVD